MTIREFQGLNTKVDSFSLDPKFSTICENARFDKIGSISKRLTRSKYNSTSLGANPIYYISRIYIGSDKYLIATYSTFLKVGDDSAGAFDSTNLKVGLTASTQWQGQTYKGFHYMGNGTNSNIRTDGTSGGTKVMGCQVPASLPTAADTTGGSLDTTAVYKYKFAWMYDDYQVSNGSAVLTDSTTSSNNAIELYDFPTAPTDATDMKFYRTEGGESIYYYHSVHTKTEVAAYLTGARYKDTTADSSLSSTVLHTDHDIPLKFEYIIEQKERLFMNSSTYGSWLYYTDIEGVTSYPDIVPSSNYLPISEDDGDEIMGIALDPMGILTVFKKNTIRKVFTEGSPDMWEVSAPFSTQGCIAPYSIAESPGGIIYLSRVGTRKEIRIFNGQDSKLISERIEPTLANISDTRIEQCVGIYAEGKYFLAYNDTTTGDTENNRVLVLDLNRDAYSIDKKGINCFSLWEGGDDWGELYSGSSEAGFVYREDTASIDLIHELKSELDTGTYDNCESSGTEQAPEVKLVSSDLSGSVGGKVANTLTSNAASTYSGEDDTAWPSGDLKSTTIAINAKALSMGYWSESLGSNGDITFQYRTGDTTGACTTASWSSKYTDPTGSDISDVDAAVYIQYQARLYTNDITEVDTPKLYRSGDYVIWISAGLGVVSETTIPFIMETGDWDMGTPFLTKRFRSIRTKSDGGEYTIKYYLNGSNTLEDTFTITSDSEVNYFTAFGENIRFRIEENSINDFTFRELSIISSLEPLRY